MRHSEGANPRRITVYNICSEASGCDGDGWRNLTQLDFARFL